MIRPSQLPGGQVFASGLIRWRPEHGWNFLHFRVLKTVLRQSVLPPAVIMVGRDDHRRVLEHWKQRFQCSVYKFVSVRWTTPRGPMVRPPRHLLVAPGSRSVAGHCGFPTWREGFRRGRAKATSPDQLSRDLDAAMSQLPRTAHREEAVSPAEELAQVQKSWGAGPHPLGTNLPAALAELEVGLVRSTGSEEADPTE